MTSWTAACQASLSFTIYWSLLKLVSTESMMPSSVVPFTSCLQSFPASESFLMSQLFTSSGQRIGASASASVLPINSEKSESESCSIMPYSLRPHGLQPTRLLCSWDFPGKSTGVGCHCLLRFFPIANNNSSTDL